MRWKPIREAFTKHRNERLNLKASKRVDAINEHNKDFVMEHGRATVENKDVTRFAWLPIKIQGYTVWLEKYVQVMMADYKDEYVESGTDGTYSYRVYRWVKSPNNRKFHIEYE